jgi:hypothetical protein
VVDVIITIFGENIGVFLKKMLFLFLQKLKYFEQKTPIFSQVFIAENIFDIKTLVPDRTGTSLKDVKVELIGSLKRFAPVANRIDTNIGLFKETHDHIQKQLLYTHSIVSSDCHT